MKAILLIAITLISSITWSQDKEASKRMKFLHKFEHALREHDQKSVLSAMDKTYYKEQLSFLKGNKVQFVNELLGGNEIGGENYINIKFNEIKSIELSEIIPLKEGGFTCIYKISDNHHTVYVSLQLIKKGRKYGFKGAVG